MVCGLRRNAVLGLIVLAGVFWAGLTPHVVCGALMTLEMQCPTQAIESDASAADVMPLGSVPGGPNDLGLALGDVSAKRSGGKNV